MDYYSTMIQNAANLATILGNLAVAVTLVIVFRQVRLTLGQLSEGRTANQLSHWQTIQNQALSFYCMLAESGLSELYTKGRTTPQTLTDSERSRFFYLCVAWFTILEHIHAVSITGYLPRHYFTGWDAALIEDLKDPGFQWFWSMEGHLFDGSFREKVNLHLSKSA